MRKREMSARMKDEPLPLPENATVFFAFACHFSK